ncbi:MAG: methylmalonyl Co-A mutase-associated GTPase MeaB [Saprospiraceae bacterium]|nr:methylmalonyl Co-A mutase-associated GTPase MeaB [Saprospiraceae bacterium]
MARKHTINPALSPLVNARHHTWKDYLEGILTGDRRWLAQAITLIESTLANDQEKAIALMSHLPEVTHPSLRLAVSGAPGAGKSTLIEQMGLLDGAERKAVAVLAIDPSSSRSRGSLLGDKTRMERLVREPQTFIRPTPSRGHLGGVGANTRETISICEAAGFDHLYIETVGVGQSEFAAAGLSDLFILVLQPGAGDRLQGMKRGIVEMADIVVVNKSDGAQEPLARKTLNEFEQALHLIHREQPTPVLLVSALEGRGIPELRMHIHELLAKRKAEGSFQSRRKEQDLEWFQQSLKRQLLQWILKDKSMREDWKTMEDAVRSGSLPPVVAAARYMESIRSLKPASG